MGCIGTKFGSRSKFGRLPQIKKCRLNVIYIETWAIWFSHNVDENEQLVSFMKLNSISFIFGKSFVDLVSIITFIVFRNLETKLNNLAKWFHDNKQFTSTMWKCGSGLFSFRKRFTPRHLDYIDRSHSNLTEFPEDVLRHERTLEELCLDANQIANLPKVRYLGYFYNFRKIDLLLSDL